MYENTLVFVFLFFLVCGHLCVLKVRRVLWGLLAPLALQVLLDALALLEIQELSASGDFQDLKVYSQKQSVFEFAH